jgi:hypothetical protein
MNCLSHLPKSLLGVAMLAIAGGAHAAVSLDLTTKGATGTINGATYTQMNLQPTGTGYIDPFVRVGMQGSAGKDVVQAYNTTVNGVLNNSNEDNWNHEVKFGQMQLQTVNNVSFMRFLLDINQTGADPKLNLDDVQVFISSAPNQSTTAFSANGLLGLANSTLVYRMDGPASPGGTLDNNKVTLDYSLNSGSGSGDMFLDIGIDKFNTAFAAAGLTTTAQKDGAYIYLYSKFGSNPYVNNDGFEEWAFLAKAAPPGGGGFSGNAPEPSSLLLAGLGLIAVRAARKRQRVTA